VGGEGEERLRWLDAVRSIDLALRGPRPATGLHGLDEHFSGTHASAAWANLRGSVETIAGLLGRPVSLGEFVQRLVAAADRLAAGRPDGARRTERRRVAGGPCARPVARPEDPRQPGVAWARVSDRPFSA